MFPSTYCSSSFLCLFMILEFCNFSGWKSFFFSNFYCKFFSEACMQMLTKVNELFWFSASIFLFTLFRMFCFYGVFTQAHIVMKPNQSNWDWGACTYFWEILLSHDEGYRNQFIWKQLPFLSTQLILRIRIKIQICLCLGIISIPG